MSSSKSVYHIFGQDGTAVVHLAAGSVRLGRTLRRAVALRKLVNHSVFVALGEDDAGRIVPKTGALRHAAEVAVSTREREVQQQASNRAQMTQSSTRRRDPYPTASELSACRAAGRPS